MINEKIMDYINNIKNKYHINDKEIFIYSFVFIILIGIISRKNITISYGLSIIFSYYIINNLLLINTNINKEENEKIKKYIRPREKIIEKYDDICDFLFKIQDLYKYNPQIYHEMIEYIKNFFIVYEESMEILLTSHKNYSIAELHMYNASNALHSILLNADGNINLDNKISKSYKILQEKLKYYLNDIKFNIKKDIKLNGYNNQTKIIEETNIKPYNFEII
jgi:hypothetical protein